MILLDPHRKRPLYLQIYDQVKAGIVSGRIGTGERLPSIRGLSESLGVGKNTVTLGYGQLCDEGYILNRKRSGFYVQDLDNQGVDLIEMPRPDWSDREPTPPLPEYRYDFRYGRINPGDFPLALWRKLSNQVFSRSNLGNIVSYPDPQGETGLKRAIMGYLNTARGVVCRPEQVLICSGTQQSLNLICRLLKDDYPGIAVEDPGYDGARVVFESNGMEILPIGLEEGGIRMDALEKSRAGLVYLTPSRQFPMGEVMPIQKRLRLLDWASRNDAVIIEDDYDSEFRYCGRPVPSIQHIDAKNRVIYMGSFSKTLAPSLRMSYMVIPRSMMASYKKMFNRYHTLVPWAEQKIVEGFIRGGYWERHIRRVRLANKKRHDTLARVLGSTMGKKVKIHGLHAGLHLVLEFSTPGCEAELIDRARDHGVGVSPVSGYWFRKDQYKNNMVVLGYSGLDEQDIINGVDRLNEAWFL